MIEAAEAVLLYVRSTASVEPGLKGGALLCSLFCCLGSNVQTNKFLGSGSRFSDLCLYK